MTIGMIIRQRPGISVLACSRTLVEAHAGVK